MDTLLRDVRYSLRRIVKTPGFAAIVVLTLALGIGANTAIFSVVNAVLLRALPYRAPDRLVTINHWYRGVPGDPASELVASVSVAGYRDYRDRTHSFEAVAVETGWRANLSGTGDPEQIPAAKASGDFFRVYGVPAQLGRTFGRDEDAPGKDRVVVISDGLWRRVFGADPGVIGKTIRLNEESYQIIGVMPAEFRDFFTRQADVWAPIAFTPDQYDPKRYTNEFLSLSARLAPGVSVAAARAEMTAFAEQLKRQYPDNFGSRWTLKVTSLDDLATSSIRTTLLVLLGAVGFVLLIACANVANLLLARAAVRIKEIAIRSALGADRMTLVRQLLTESVLLALAGGVLGLALAYGGVRALVALYPSIPRADDIAIDGRVMAFTLGVAVLTGLIFGLLPALQTSRTDLQRTLKEGGRSGAADVSGHTVRRLLVVSEMALALTLLVGAGLLIRSVARLQKVDPGFRPDHLLTFNLALPDVKYHSDTSQRLFFEQALARVAEVPGVTGVGATTTLPFSGSWSTGSFDVEGYTPGKDHPGPWGDIRVVNADFFRTMGIALIQGRTFSAQDQPESQGVVVIDEELARRYFANTSPIGKRVGYAQANGGKGEWYTIVGVVHHTMHEALDAKPRIQLYFAMTQRPFPFTSVAVRTVGDPLQATRAVAAAIRSVDAAMPLANIQTMDDLLESSMGQRRLTMFLLGTFAGIALLLATIGIYGVMSYSVTQRARELGIRMALGAGRAGVLRLVLGQGMQLAAIGIGIGIVGSIGLTRLLSTQLYSISATDPATFVLVGAVLTAVAVVAVLVPALRATRVDPVVALREE